MKNYFPLWVLTAKTASLAIRLLTDEQFDWFSPSIPISCPYINQFSLVSSLTCLFLSVWRTWFNYMTAWSAILSIKLWHSESVISAFVHLVSWPAKLFTCPMYDSDNSSLIYLAPILDWTYFAAKYFDKHLLTPLFSSQILKFTRLIKKTDIKTRKSMQNLVIVPNLKRNHSKSASLNEAFKSCNIYRRLKIWRFSKGPREKYITRIPYSPDICYSS